MIALNWSLVRGSAGWLLAVVAIGWCAAAGAQDQPPMPQLTEHHELLKKDVGVWDAEVTLWPMPGAEPMKSRGTEKNELLGDGMWVISRFEGEIAGMKFAGFGTFGYDPAEQKYVGTWVDSMSPHLTTMKADYDAQTKTMTAVAEGRDHMTGQIAQSKMISRYHDDGTRSFEIHAQDGEDGDSWKMMEIQYTRRDE